MSNYEKPVVVMAEESTEGVYLASGDHLEQCDGKIRILDGLQRIHPTQI